MTSCYSCKVREECLTSGSLGWGNTLFPGMVLISWGVFWGDLFFVLFFKSIIKITVRPWYWQRGHFLLLLPMLLRLPCYQPWLLVTCCLDATFFPLIEEVFSNYEPYAYCWGYLSIYPGSHMGQHLWQSPKRRDIKKDPCGNWKAYRDFVLYCKWFIL